MKQSKRILGFGAGIVIALLAVTFFMAGNFTSTTNAADGGPEMALTVSDGGTCEGSTCTVPSGGAFTLVVEILTAPPAYVLAQSFIVYGPNITYKATATAGDVFIWPDCNTSVALTASTSPNSVLHGCLTGLLPPLPESSYTGDLLALSMNCAADGTHLVELLPEGDELAGTSGAAFNDPTGDVVGAKTSNLTVICGSAPTGPTNTPTETPTEGPTVEVPTPTDTPVPPDQPCGDVDGDGDVTSLDALQTLWLVAGLIDSTDKDADVNGDGDVTSVDAALILQIVAGLYSCS